MISALRAATESDSYTGELTNFVYKEMPTRILLQLKAIYEGLKNLDENYPDERALKVIQRVALSSMHPIRLEIILNLIKNEQMTTTQIQKSLNIGWKTVVTQLYTARQLGLVDYTEDQYDTEGEGSKKWATKLWYVTNNEIIEYLKEKQELEDEVADLFK